VFSGFMTTVWLVATVVAVIGGVVGFFVVLRGAAFPAHALPNSAFAGAAAASLLGIDALIGLGVFAAGAALAIAGLGRRGRPDVATALALVLGLALGALFLSRSQQYEPELYSLLFGEILGVAGTQVIPVVALAVGCLLTLGILYRPLLYASAVPGVAEARGVAAGAMELAFLLVLAAATALTVPVVGALLIFSLMIGPPAAARSFTHRPVAAIGGSVLIALVTVWVAIAASYATNWPVGFFVGTLSAGAYAAGRAWAAGRGHRERRRSDP
jgi:zinc/manganese transport system permease protein